MGVAEPGKMRDYIKRLHERKKEIEREFEKLLEERKRGLISEEEYERRKRKLEREYVEIMDRLVQMRYLSGEEPLFA